MRRIGNKIMITAILMTIILGGYSNQKQSNNTASNTEIETQTAGSNEEEQTSIKVAETSLCVNITFPAEYLEGITEEGIKYMQENRQFPGYIIHEDSSVTFILTKEQYQEMQAFYEDNILISSFVNYIYS